MSDGAASQAREEAGRLWLAGRPLEAGRLLTTLVTPEARPHWAGRVLAWAYARSRIARVPAVDTIVALAAGPAGAGVDATRAAHAAIEAALLRAERSGRFDSLQEAVLTLARNAVRLLPGPAPEPLDQRAGWWFVASLKCVGDELDDAFAAEAWAVLAQVEETRPGRVVARPASAPPGDGRARLGARPDDAKMRGRQSMKKVLMTGASGAIGVSLRDLLSDRYALRLQERPGGQPVGPARAGEEIVEANIADLAGMRAAVRGTDAVIHLAASSAVGTPWDDALQNNIVGVYTTLEAMRQEGVRRMVFASTNHVTGYNELKGRPCYPDMPVRPDGFYGASKAFGEALSRFYVDEHGLEVICLRIGSWQPEPKNKRSLSTWLSPRDMAQLAWRAIETPLTWGIFYAISGNARRYWDIGPTQEQLGYEPEDDGERFASRFEGQAAQA